MTKAEKPRKADRVVALFEREGPRVHALARRICSGRDADDLVQDTFLHAFRAIDQLENPENPRPWLFAIAHRACQRMRRRRAGEPKHLASFEELLPRPDAPVPELLARSADPHDDRLRAEARELVEQGLAELPEPFRIPLLLADVAELKLTEIAAILGLQEATVKTRIHRARLKLREILARGLPQRATAPHSPHTREVCLDLLRARLSAFDQGVPFPYSSGALCERCATVFATLDLAASVCGALDRDSLPPGLRDQLRAAVGASAGNPAITK